MQISDEGLDAILANEGLRLKAYKDIGGVWTIGYGHTKGVKQNQVITPAQAKVLFRQDLAPVEKTVNWVVDHSKIPVTQGMYDAMCSLAFNIGIQGFTHSSVVSRLLRGDKSGAADAFLMWNKVKGITSRGLVNRRRSERKRFLS